MSEPGVSYALLDARGAPLSGWDEDREYYAASTVKLAVAAALMFAVEAGSLTLEQQVTSRRRFSSRIPGAPDFEFALDGEESDPGLPADGTPVSLGWCLDRMITVSSNETTNLIIESLGESDVGAASPTGVRGLEMVREACERLGVPGVRMTRLICDYAAKDAGFTHATSARDLARLMWAITCGDALSPPSRGRLLGLLRAQRFPIIATALPEGALWASKSGWDDGIRHDVALTGEPGSPGCRVLAVCTEGFAPHGAQQLIGVLVSGALRAE